MFFVKTTARFLTAVVGTGMVLTLFSFGLWPLETASLWIPWYLLLAVLGMCGCVVAGSGRWAGVAALCAAAALAMMLPQYLPRARAGESTGTASLRVLQVNVYAPGNDPAYLLALVREARPDVVLLQEVDEKWKAFLKPLEDLYPHHRYSPRYTGGGPDLAQFWSAKTVSERDLHEEELPATELTLNIQGHNVRVLNAHTAAPFKKGRADRYRHQMDLLARYAAACEMPLVLAGDLNAGPWSRHYTALLETGGLVSARRGFGGLGSWPSFLGPLRIALDHLLVSSELHVRDCRLGPGIGSDHRPMITEVAVE